MTTRREEKLCLPWFGGLVACLAVVTLVDASEPERIAQAGKQSRKILAETGVEGGLIVHLGCGDGVLTAAMRVTQSYLVQGLDTDPNNVRKAREHIHSLGLYGKVSADRLDSNRLPYVDNLVNLLVAEELDGVSEQEVMRVLCPHGVAYVKRDGQWTKSIKPRSKEIDEWTHYMHDASNNPVAHDNVVGPPRRLQWVGSPRYSRHHDRMSSINAVVSAGGRVFYIFDEASRVSALFAPQWTLIARDAFNGTVLWKRPIEDWHTHLWPLKSGPANLPRRLVAVGNRVYVTLGIEAPLVALDGATGKTVRIYQGTENTEELILSDGVLFVLANKDEKRPTTAELDRRRRRGYTSKYWDEASATIMAIRAESGETLWAEKHPVLPVTLSADSTRVVFHDGTCVVALDRKTGKEQWRSNTVPRSEVLNPYYAPTLVLYKDVVLFSGGETAGTQVGWYTSGKDTITALAAESGKELWNAYHPPSGYRSAEDIIVANDLVWTGETTSGRAEGVFTGRDPRTGDVKVEFPPDVKTYWFHHRCYRGKATDNFLLMSRTGIEFVDVSTKKWTPHHWVRGACLYGVMPANGMVYAPQHPCACYLEAKQYGFNALAPAMTGPRIPQDVPETPLLEKGPAYGTDIAVRASGGDWPTYRHDAARSGRASTAISTKLQSGWKTDLGGKLSSPVIAEGKVIVALIESHTVHALDAGSGDRVWEFTAGARVDSPPTVFNGRVLFGSADGWVYCLRAADGVLAWRFRAAPMDQRLMAFEQVESVWPVHGSVLVQDGVVYFVSGRSMFLDGGLNLWRLDPATGNVLSKTALDDRDRQKDKDLQDYVSWLNMPPALPDILSSDGRLVYMRSQPFELDGTRLPLEAMPREADADRGAPQAVHKLEHSHVFCPTGFLDDSWWHRTYWLYGSTYVSGWAGYYRAGKTAPAGRILVFDDERVYGFGRKPQYYRWTTQIEHQLFSTDRLLPEPDSGPKESRIRVANSKSLDPASKPLTVEAWVKSDRPAGVILARGGSAQGYALLLQNGRPAFAIRTGQKLATVAAKQRIASRWTHLTGVLTSDKQLQIYVNGNLAGSAAAPALIAANPREAMEIGADDGSLVGNYRRPLPFAGVIDEIRIYHRALSADEVQQHFTNPKQKRDDKSLALAYSFDKGNAKDASGNANHGRAEGAVAVEGKFSRGMRFTGGTGNALPYLVKHHWTKDLPLFPRAMVLSGDKLFLAGPADTIDEEQALRQINDPKVKQALAEQASALEGKKGALLWAVSTTGAEKLTEHQLASPPVFDGMAAASRNLYVSCQDGSVVCLASE